MYKVILVPLDGSKQSESILPYVESLAGCYRAKVILLKVMDPPIMLGSDEVIDISKYQAERREMRQKTQAYLCSVKEVLRQKNIQASTIIDCGSVVKTIIDVADRENVDLLAMVSQGWTGSNNAVYGSTTAGVLQRINRPLVVIRSPRTAA